MSGSRFYPLGYPVNLSCDSGDAAEAGSHLWAGWPQLFDVPALDISIRLHRGTRPRRKPVFSAPSGALLFHSDHANFARFDPVLRQGCITVSAEAVRTSLFRHHFLEALVLTALDSVFFTPLHAACISRAGAGILLCGDSGAGKSSLAYACALGGWTLVSDDAVHVAPGKGRIGVGGSNTIRLRPPSRAIFPKIAELPERRAPNNKPVIEIDAVAHGFSTARSAAIGPCIFLRRRPGPAVWRAFEREPAVAYFLKYLAPRDTTRALRHLREFVVAPKLLEYESVEDAVRAIGTRAAGCV